LVTINDVSLGNQIFSYSFVVVSVFSTPKKQEIRSKMFPSLIFSSTRYIQTTRSSVFAETPVRCKHTTKFSRPNDVVDVKKLKCPCV